MSKPVERLVRTPKYSGGADHTVGTNTTHTPAHVLVTIAPTVETTSIACCSKECQGLVAGAPVGSQKRGVDTRGNVDNAVYECTGTPKHIGTHPPECTPHGTVPATKGHDTSGTHTFATKSGAPSKSLANRKTSGNIANTIRQRR